MDFRQSLERIRWFRSSDELIKTDMYGARFGFSTEQPQPLVYKLTQVHGARIVEVGDEQSQADGLWSSRSGQKIAIQTADCLPLLIAFEGCVFALHIGWKGLVRGMVPSFVGQVESLGLKLGQARVLIGPSISPSAFEVGPELVEAFYAYFNLRVETDIMAWLLTKGAADRWYLDLAGAAGLDMVLCGLNPEQVSATRECSFDFNTKWHSYRRSAGAAGRNWSWIELP